MPFFTRVFRGKDSTKKPAKFPAVEQDQTPSKPSWTDAWQRTEVAPEEVHDLLRGCTHELKARGMFVAVQNPPSISACVDLLIVVYSSRYSFPALAFPSQLRSFLCAFIYSQLLQ